MVIRYRWGLIGLSSPVRCDGETFVLLLHGRLKAEEAMVEGLVSFEGDQQSATALYRWLGMPLHGWKMRVTRHGKAK